MSNRENELGALWLKTSAQGKKFMSGRLTLEGGSVVDVVVFKNEYKSAGDNKPDYRVYKSQPREGWGSQKPRGDNFADLDDDIPF
jgi:uncharacterized protein (DUF736 family)